MAPGGREQVRLQCPLESLSDRSGDRSAGGRRFHVAGLLTTKLRCPVAVRATWTGLANKPSSSFSCYRCGDVVRIFEGTRIKDLSSSRELLHFFIFKFCVFVCSSPVYASAAYTASGGVILLPFPSQPMSRAFGISFTLQQYWMDFFVRFVGTIHYHQQMLGVALWTQPAVLAYWADQALPVIDTIWYHQQMNWLQCGQKWNTREQDMTENSNSLQPQGDHLSGKPGNISEFDSCQGNVGDFTEVREVSGKKPCPEKVALNCLL